MVQISTELRNTFQCQVWHPNPKTTQHPSTRQRRARCMRKWNFKMDESSMTFHPDSRHEIIYHIANTHQTIINIMRTQKPTSTENPHGYRPHFQSYLAVS